jgi:hypothetical protein
LHFHKVVENAFSLSSTHKNSFIYQNSVETNYAVYAGLSDLRFTTAVGLSSFGNTTYPSSFKGGIESEKAFSTTLWKCKP